MSSRQRRLSRSLRFAQTAATLPAGPRPVVVEADSGPCSEDARSREPNAIAAGRRPPPGKTEPVPADATLRRLGAAAAGAVTGPAVLARAGLLRPMRPDIVGRTALAFLRFGISPAAAYSYGAARYPGAIALADSRTSLSFREADALVCALSARLRDAGARRGHSVGLLCRNHAGQVLTVAALSAVGADVVLLNTASSPAETAAAVEDLGVVLVVHDEELDSLLEAVPAGVGRVQVERPGEEMRAARPPRAHGSSALPSPQSLLLAPFTALSPRARSRFVLLTSGTTGRARGAGRHAPHSVEPLVALLSRIPLKTRDTTLIASPLFHAWGFGNLGVALAMSSTVVLRERFDPEETLATIASQRVRVLIAVPTMLERMVELRTRVRRRYDISSLEVVVSSGSALHGNLAVRFMDLFGDVLYNLYGSTEAAYASIATPAELRRDPATAGRAPHGTSLRVVDPVGGEVQPGATGRIAVRNVMSLRPSPVAAGAPAGFVITGDLGHLTEDGLLHVDGREDDMIVSGGENVYPREVEEALASHPAVREAAVVGVPDDLFGERLRAFVVPRGTARPDPDDLRRHVRSRLANFKVPRDVVVVESLPRNAAGKTLHRELRQR